MKYLLILVLLFSVPLLAAEKRSTKKGYVNHHRLYLTERRTARQDTVRTTGYIGTSYVNLRTRETKREIITSGYIDGKYVRIKEKKD
jgi:hypothetical protein